MGALHEGRSHRLGGILARWHCWRCHYTTERGYARASGPAANEDELEEALMHTVEHEVAQLAQDLQRALGQLAQEECLGVTTAELADIELQAYAAELLAHRLQRVGLL